MDLLGCTKGRTDVRKAAWGTTAYVGVRDAPAFCRLT